MRITACEIDATSFGSLDFEKRDNFLAANVLQTDSTNPQLLTLNDAALDRLHSLWNLLTPTARNAILVLAEASLTSRLT